MKNNHKTTCVMAVMLLCLCTGCAGTGNNSQNDSLSDNTLSDNNTQTEITDNAEYTTDNDSETTTEEAVNTIADSQYAIKDYQVSGTDNLYRLYMDMPDETWISSISECGDNVLVVYYEYGDSMESLNYYMKLVNPLTLEESDSFTLPEGTYSEEDVYIDEDNNISIMNKEKADLYFFNDKLEEYKDLSLGDSGIDTYSISKDFQYIYYMSSGDNQIYQYNTGTEEVDSVCQDFTIGENEYAYISGCVEGEKTNYILVGTTDWESGEITYNLYDVETGSVYESNMPGAAYITNMEYIEGDNSNYLAKCNVDGLAEIVSCGNVISLSDYNEYNCVNDDLADRKVISTLSDYDSDSDTDTFGLKIYDLDTGLIENEAEFSFNMSDYDYMYAGNTLYMKDLNLVVWQASDSNNGIFVWDLTEKDSKSEDESSHLYTWEDLVAPDEDDIDQLRKKAEKIGQAAGVEVYVGDDVLECTQTTYQYTPVNNIVRIDKALDILEQELARYPEGMLAQLDDSYGSALKIFLSGRILPISDIAIDTAIGVQDTFEDDTWLVVDITSIEYTQTIHHEILHAVELHMENEGYYFDDDTWNQFNPEGFQYDYNYIENAESDNYDYVTGDIDHSDEISFIDIYSKSMPTEDRARIMEYAMMEAQCQTGYFEYTNIHDKLAYISEQIRKCFDTTGWPEVTEWEKCL
jgi:hypothetical protein